MTSLEKPAKNSRWPAQHSGWSSAWQSFCKLVYKFYCPLSVFGLENLPKKPFIICSNHSSHMDSTVLMVGAGSDFQKTGLIAAKDYFFDQGNRFFLHYLMNLVPIERGVGVQAIKDSVVACKSFLDSGGEALIIYPEGTRSVTGKIGRFKQGAAILAHNLDIPLIPAHILGARESMPKGAILFWPKKISLHLGKPIRVADYLAHDEMKDKKAVFCAIREATHELERRIKAMRKESLGDVAQ